MHGYNNGNNGSPERRPDLDPKTWARAIEIIGSVAADARLRFLIEVTEARNRLGSEGVPPEEWEAVLGYQEGASKMIEAVLDQFNAEMPDLATSSETQGAGH